MDILDKAVLILWGKTLYLNVTCLPEEGRTIEEAYKIAEEIIKVHETGKWYYHDDSEWWAEGAPYQDGSAVFSMPLVKSVFKRLERPLEHDTTFYRYSEHDGNYWDWVSVTASRGAYGYDPGSEYEHVLDLKKGTPVIDTHGLCDKDEWIVRTEIFQKFYKQVGK